MSNPGAHGNRHSIKRVATEFGQFFDEWTRRPSSSGWSSPVREIDGALSISWSNLAGTVMGTAKFRESLSSFSLSSSGTYSNQHTVHIRALNTNSFFYYEIGPATALHNAGGVADHCYGVVCGNLSLSLPFIAIIEVNTGGFGINVLTSIAGSSAIVQRGDVVSLAYRWNSSGGGSADLSVLKNGQVLGSATVSSGAYNIGTVTDGRFGLYGDLIQPIVTVDMGHLLQEWWVTDGYQTFEEVPSIYPGLSRSLRLSFMGVQRYTTSPTPKIRALVSGQLIRCRWSYKRLGGCATLSADFVYPSESDPVAKSFRSPTNDDWSSGNWIGAEVVLALPFTGAKLDESTSSTAHRDAVWRGRVTKVKVDVETRIVSMQAEGLFEAMKERFIDSRDYVGETIRGIVSDVVQSTAKSPTLGSMFRFNPSKIVGLNSVLDLPITLSVRAQSAKAILDKVAAYLPDGVVWGVDRDGDFFLDQQTDPWTVGHDGSGALSFDVRKQAADFDLSMDLGRIKTIVTVMGREDEGQGTTAATNTAGRISGRAESDRASAIFGEREVIHTDSGIEEAGLAFKVAIARLKALAVPRITGSLKITAPFSGIHSLWESLTISSPRVMVREESGLSRRLRFYNDVSSYSMKERGSFGADVNLPSTASERIMERSWLVHAAMRFDFPQSGAGNDDFLLGRPNDSGGASFFGWGSLWWDETGKLQWRYTDTTPTTWVLDTGVSVSTAGSGTVVHLTVWRDSAGTFRFYNGNTLTNTVAHPTQVQKTSETGPWRFFKHAHTLPGGYRNGDFAVRHFWVFNAVALEALNSLTSTPVQEFIARNNAGPLHRNDSHGLRLYLPLREQGSSSSTPWSGVQGSEPLIPISRVVPTVVKSGQSGTPDGPDFEEVSRGLVIGTEKKFGGPFVFNAERVTYDYDARTGQLTRDFVLGEFPLDGFATIARIEAQVEKMADVLKRVTETL